MILVPAAVKVNLIHEEHLVERPRIVAVIAQGLREGLDGRGRHRALGLRPQMLTPVPWRNHDQFDLHVP